MKRLVNLLIKGIGTSLVTFTILGIVWDIKNGGNYIMNNWSYTKMVVAAIIVGIGFAVPALIYYNPNIPSCMKVLFHMGLGCTILLITSFIVGWIPMSLGLKECVFTVMVELLISFILWLCFTLYYKRVAKRMNEQIKNMKSKE